MACATIAVEPAAIEGFWGMGVLMNELGANRRGNGPAMGVVDTVRTYRARVWPAPLVSATLTWKLLDGHRFCT